jgi:hypothetical protein
VLRRKEPFQETIHSEYHEQYERQHKKLTEHKETCVDGIAVLQPEEKAEMANKKDSNSSKLCSGYRQSARLL